MTHAIPLATLRGIAAMAPRRLRRELKIAIKQIERAFRPVFVSCVEAPAEHGRLVSPDDLEAIRNRLQNIHGTGLAVMQEDAEAIAQRLGLSWDVEAPSLTPSEVEADRNAADGRAEGVHVVNHPEPRAGTPTGRPGEMAVVLTADDRIVTAGHILAMHRALYDVSTTIGR